MDDQARRRELGRFLRSRRNAVTPDSVGMPRGFRRRTPGLRREEVAELASCSIAWYTWLEQGRRMKVSEGVLSAIARALKLSDDEREHLLRLGASPRPPQPDPVLHVRHQAVLNALNPLPAYVRDSHWNIQGWNRTFEVASGNTHALASEPNLLVVLFTNQRFRELEADWSLQAERAVAQFRFESSDAVDDPRLAGLVERLSDESPDFRMWWQRYDVGTAAGTSAQWRQPDGHVLHFERSVMSFQEAPSLRIVTLNPVPGTGTRSRLRSLLADRAFDKEAELEEFHGVA